MKRLLSICAAALMTVAAFAQDDLPTLNWPYLFPDFMEGEVMMTGGKIGTGKYNIHLGLGALHFVNDGKIAEVSTGNIILITMGNDVLRNVNGKMMKVLAQTDGGFVLQETLADYSAVVRNDGAYGGSLSNSAKGFSYDENLGNYGYLVTDGYEDLLSIKNEAEILPVVSHTYLYIGNDLIQAGKKNVSALEGVDKKAFSEFLKSEGIKWKEVDDLVKVVNYIAEHKNQ